jgi:uncharacterized protein VirK/YbjX
MLQTSIEPAIAGPAVRLPSLAWPDARTMFADVFDVGWQRRTKYALRLALTYRVRNALLREFAGMAFADSLFRACPRAFYPLMNHLLDRRLGARARLKATLTSLRVVCAALGERARVDTLLGYGIELGLLPGGARIKLAFNDVSFHEGLWQLALVGTDGTRLYSLGFGFVDESTVLIGNVQGPSGIENLARVSDLTHAAHGMRPPHLLLHVLRLLAARLGAATLWGIDPEHHVQGRWNLRDSRLRFDYRGLWSECGAARGAHGHWMLPLVPALRPLEEIPANRRATYRRRYAMLQMLQGELAARLPDRPAGRDSQALEPRTPVVRSVVAEVGSRTSTVSQRVSMAPFELRNAPS